MAELPASPVPLPVADSLLSLRDARAEVALISPASEARCHSSVLLPASSPLSWRTRACPARGLLACPSLQQEQCRLARFQTGELCLIMAALADAQPVAPRRLGNQTCGGRSTVQVNWRAQRGSQVLPMQGLPIWTSLWLTTLLDCRTSCTMHTCLVAIQGIPATRLSC